MIKTTLLSAALCAAFAVSAQNFGLVTQDKSSVTFTHELRQTPFKYVTIDGAQYVDFGQTHKVLSMEKGAPALPLFHTSIQLPATGNPVLIVESDGVTEIQNVEIAPSKGNLKRNVTPSSIPYSFGSAYSQNAFYPASVATLNDPFVWRSLRGQNITISPYQYNPVTKTLRIHENLRVRVVYQEQVSGLNEVAKSELDRTISGMQERYVLNPSGKRYTAVGEEGEMLIITSPDLENSIQALADWKIQKGIKTTVVTTDVAGTTDTQIKSYIQTFYNNNSGLIYILLVGDHSDIPAHSYGISSAGETLWSDSYYGQLAGGSNDFYPEAFVGRFSGSATEVATMVNRVLEYEKNPAAGNWMEKGIGIGSSEGSGIGDDGEIDYVHIRNIRTKLMDYGYTTVYEFYDGTRGGQDASGNPTAASVLEALNDGVGLFNYTGHGDVNLIYTSNFTSTNVNAATNNGKYPLVVSVACNNGTFTSGTCISEAWLRADNNGSPAGAIGAAGSSILMAWAQPMQTQDEMTAILTGEYPNNYKETIGGLFYNGQFSMLENYPDDDGKEVMQTWVFFGDPSVVFRDKQTLALSISHASHSDLGMTSFTVQCDTDGATIALTQNGVILGKGVVSGGSVTITIDAVTSNLPIVVTATKQNYKPYQGVVQVADGPAGIDELSAQIAMYPNPANNVVNLVSTGDLLIGADVMTLTGQTVATSKAANGTMEIDLNNMAAGSYLVRISTTKGNVIQHLEVIK